MTHIQMNKYSKICKNICRFVACSSLWYRELAVFLSFDKHWGGGGGRLWMCIDGYLCQVFSSREIWKWEAHNPHSVGMSKHKNTSHKYTNFKSTACFIPELKDQAEEAIVKINTVILSLFLPFPWRNTLCSSHTQLVQTQLYFVSLNAA